MATKIEKYFQMYNSFYNFFCKIKNKNKCKSGEAHKTDI